MKKQQQPAAVLKLEFVCRAATTRQPEFHTERNKRKYHIPDLWFTAQKVPLSQPKLRNKQEERPNFRSMVDLKLQYMLLHILYSGKPHTTLKLQLWPSAFDE